ncbi:hypothetical protein ACP70R_001783 [Stipagrostis hirtigluma subsp. patula]
MASPPSHLPLSPTGVTNRRVPALLASPSPPPRAPRHRCAALLPSHPRHALRGGRASPGLGRRRQAPAIEEEEDFLKVLRGLRDAACSVEAGNNHSPALDALEAGADDLLAGDPKLSALRRLLSQLRALSCSSRAASAQAGKGRPVNRKQKDWRLQTSFSSEEGDFILGLKLVNPLTTKSS